MSSGFGISERAARPRRIHRQQEDGLATTDPCLSHQFRLIVLQRLVGVGFHKKQWVALVLQSSQHRILPEAPSLTYSSGSSSVCASHPLLSSGRLAVGRGHRRPRILSWSEFDSCQCEHGALSVRPSSEHGQHTIRSAPRGLIRTKGQQPGYLSAAADDTHMRPQVSI